MINTDFKFDFKSSLAKAYHDDEIYQSISYIAKGFDMKSIGTEDVIRQLININSSVLHKGLTEYNHKLLNSL